MCSERASLAQVVRQEFTDQLAASQAENQRLKAELAELRAHQQMELDEVHQRWVVRTSGGGTGGGQSLGEQSQGRGAITHLPFSPA